MADAPKPAKLLTDIVLDEVTVCKEPANDDCRAEIVKSRNPSPTLVETDMSTEYNPELETDDLDLAEIELSPEEAEELAAEIEELNESGELVPAFAALIAGAEQADEIIGKMLELHEALEDDHEELKKMAGLLADRVEKMGAAGDEDQSLASAIRKSLGGADLDPQTAMRIDALELVAKQAEEKEAVEKAKALGVGDATKLGPALLTIRKRLGGDIADLIEGEFKAAGALISKSRVFTPIGSSNPSDANSPIAKANIAAEDIRKSDPKLTQAEAVAKAFEADPALYEAYLAEQRAKQRR